MPQPKVNDATGFAGRTVALQQHSKAKVRVEREQEIPVPRAGAAASRSRREERALLTASVRTGVGKRWAQPRGDKLRSE